MATISKYITSCTLCVLVGMASIRNAAIAFLHGFILGKSGSSKFNLEKLTQQTDAFVDGCLDKPGNKALDVMMKIKS
jgi:hypothetical protein